MLGGKEDRQVAGLDIYYVFPDDCCTLLQLRIMKLRHLPGAKGIHVIPGVENSEVKYFYQNFLSGG